MQYHDERRSPAERILAELDAAEKRQRENARALIALGRDETERDAQDAARDRIILAHQAETIRALIAIGRVLFARFNNTDEQLDRIEATLTVPPPPPPQRIPVVAVITAVRNRQS